MKDYHINIFYSEEDEGYIADIPDLKACSAFAEKPDQALEEVLAAKKSWLEAARVNRSLHRNIDRLSTRWHKITWVKHFKFIIGKEAPNQSIQPDRE